MEGRHHDEAPPTRVAKLQPVAIGLALLVTVMTLAMIGFVAERTDQPSPRPVGRALSAPPATILLQATRLTQRRRAAAVRARPVLPDPLGTDRRDLLRKRSQIGQEIHSGRSTGPERGPLPSSSRMSQSARSYPSAPPARTRRAVPCLLHRRAGQPRGSPIAGHRRSPRSSPGNRLGRDRERTPWPGTLARRAARPPPTIPDRSASAVRGRDDRTPRQARPRATGPDLPARDAPASNARSRPGPRAGQGTWARARVFPFPGVLARSHEAPRDLRLRGSPPRSEITSASWSSQDQA